jgi:hypothetical protein
MALLEIKKAADKSVGQAFLPVAGKGCQNVTDRNVCPTYCPMDGFAAGRHSAASRPPLNDWTKLITPI